MLLKVIKKKNKSILVSSIHSDHRGKLRAKDLPIFSRNGSCPDLVEGSNQMAYVALYTGFNK